MLSMTPEDRMGRNLMKKGPMIECYEHKGDKEPKIKVMLGREVEKIGGFFEKIRITYDGYCFETEGLVRFYARGKQ